MIKSEKQYKIAKGKLKSLEDAIKNPRQDLPKELAEAAKGQISDLAEELREEIRQYEKIKDEGLRAIPIRSASDLLEAPILYRLAKGMTVDEFARKVGLPARQIMRYEANSYENLTVETLIRILEHLDLEWEGQLNVLEGEKESA